MLSESLTSESVPDDLVYFADGDRCLVVNPEVGAWQVIDGAELDLLRRLALGQSFPLSDPEGIERALARLVMACLIYLPGRRPRPRRMNRTPRTVYYAITDGCNLRCPHCYASSAKRRSDELDTAASLDLIEQIAAIGAETVVFTGGEALLRADLFIVAQRVRERGMQAHLITNGTLLRRGETARSIADTFTAVTVSLDGGTAEVHERMRGKGTFARTLTALRLLNEVGVRPLINFVATQESVKSLPALCEALSGLEVRAVRAIHHSALGRGASDGFLFEWPDYQALYDFFASESGSQVLLPEGSPTMTQRSGKVNCGMGGTEIYVDSRGDVFPCRLITDEAHLAGNIRQGSLSEIFAAPVMVDLRSSAVFAGENLPDCHGCYVRGICAGGCRAFHRARTGDLRRNSREVCRMQRHETIASMWASAGAQRDSVVDNPGSAHCPVVVRTGERHPAFDPTASAVTAAVADAGMRRRNLRVQILGGAR